MGSATLQFLSGNTLSVVILTAALIAARVLPVVVLAPWLGGEIVPNEVKIGTGVALVLLLYPVVGTELPPMQALPYLGLLLKEIMVGLVLTYVSGVIFEAVRAAGTLIDTAGGANMATAMVPEIQQQASLFANLQLQLSVVLFFTIGGHRLFFASLFESFRAVPLMHYPTLTSGPVPLVELTLRLGGDLFIVAFMLSAPVLAAIFLTDVTMGLLNRVAPTINVFFMAMPIKMMTSVAIVLFSLTLLVKELEGHTADMLHRLAEAIRFLR
jgi:flagellar biosynthetic protein FliR